jgi:hypothetical protein
MNSGSVSCQCNVRAGRWWSFGAATQASKQAVGGRKRHGVSDQKTMPDLSSDLTELRLCWRDLSSEVH